jgi:hypothetical protein
MSIEIKARIQMPEAMNTMTYYFPLKVTLNDMCEDDEEDEYLEQGDYPTVPSTEAVFYEDEILGQIAEDNSYFDTNRLLAEYFKGGSTLGQKVYSMLPTVEAHGGELWGAMVMKVAGKLTPDEVAELKDYITGQNSDGYGEGLEQREIKVSDGELYVSFWTGEKDYAIYTQDEFREKMDRRQVASGAPRRESRGTNDLPDCPMIGADGNVFSLMGLVSRTLKDHGMRNQAKEMQGRVTSSGSYDEALAIMMEYVNPVSREDIRQSGGFGGMRMQL